MSISRRPLPVVGLVSAVLATAALAAGCDAAQSRIDDATAKARDSVNNVAANAAAKSVGAATAKAAKAAGIELAGTPQCTPDVEVDAGKLTATGTVTCTATTTKGQKVTSKYTGELSSTACTGQLTIAVNGQRKVSTPNLDGCSIAKVFGTVVGGES